MPATGEDIPPELFETILSYIGSDIRISRANASKDVQTQKSIRSVCSLVCRYWSKHCRWWIFASIDLHTHEDVKTLASFLSAPPVAGLPPISSYIDNLQVVYDIEASTVPCIHHMYPLIRLLPNWRTCFLDVSGPLSTETKKPPPAPRILNTPRNLPAAFFPFSTVSFKNVRFHSFAELARLVRSMCDLVMLSCDKVSWDGDRNIPSSSRACFTRPGVEIRALRCQNNAFLVTQILLSLMPLSRSRQNTDPVFVSNTTAVVGTIHGWIDRERPIEILSSETRTVLEAEDFTHREITKPFWRVRVVSQGEDRVFLRPTIYYFFPQESLPPRHPAHPPTCPVDIVVHAYYTGLKPERDWAQLLEQILTIPNLQSIIIALPTYDDVQIFWDRNNDAMQHLMTNTWARYVYSHANNSRAWAIVDPVTLERMGYELRDLAPPFKEFPTVVGVQESRELTDAKHSAAHVNAVGSSSDQ